MVLCSDLVDVVWSDDRGVRRKTTAILEEIAPAGAMVLLDMDRPPRRIETVVIQPLDAGEYKFYDEFHMATAKGVIVAK